MLVVAFGRFAEPTVDSGLEYYYALFRADSGEGGTVSARLQCGTAFRVSAVQKSQLGRHIMLG